MIVFFRHFSLFHHCQWVQPLIGFAYYIGSTLLSDHIIAIYHHYFFSKDNGIISSSPLLIVIFWSFYVTPPHGWVKPTIGFAGYIKNYFSERSNYCYIYIYICLDHNGVVLPSPLLIFIFWIFAWFLLTYECYHSFRLLITLKVTFWKIVLSPYIITVFLPSEWHHFTVTVVDFYMLRLFYSSYLWMTATTCWYHIFHWNYFVGWSYFNFIDMVITDSIWSTPMRNLTLSFYSLALTIKIEQTFFKWSILNESRLSKDNDHFTGY